MVAVSKVCRRSFGIFRLTWPGSRFQGSVIAAGAPVLPRLAALMSSSAAQLVRLGAQRRIQRLLDCPADHLAEVIPDPSLIDLDDLPHQLRLCLLVHPKLLSMILKGAASPCNVRKILYVYPSPPWAGGPRRSATERRHRIKSESVIGWARKRLQGSASLN
jgi:hypothetical protein